MTLPKFREYKKGVTFKYVSMKLDGHLMKVTVDGDGQIKVLSKNDKDKTDKILAIEHINAELCCLPLNTSAVAELHYPDGYSTDIPTMLINADKRLRLTFFAAPLLAGRDMRDAMIEEVEELMNKYGVEFVPHHPNPGGFDCVNISRLLQEAEEHKFEGWVLKEGHWTGWYKLKPVKTLDAVIVDVTESDSDTYAGHMKAVKLALYDYKAGHTKMHHLGECGGGFTKAFKLSKSYKEMVEHIKGKVVEVSYDSVTKHGKLRWPRFMRFREDKNPKDCDTMQIK